MEMMDRPAIHAVEEFVHAGYPLDVEALLIVELDGPAAEVDHLLQRVEAIAKECRSTGELLRAHARLLAGWMRSSGFRNGCPITTVLLELAPRERAVAEAGRKAYAARVAILSDKLMADGHSRARSEALAILCTSAMQGALIQARVERSGRPIEVTAGELARLLERAADA